MINFCFTKTEERMSRLRLAVYSEASDKSVPLFGNLPIYLIAVEVKRWNGEP